MNYLFIHQNFPAQYQHVVRHLAAQPEHRQDRDGGPHEFLGDTPDDASSARFWGEA